MKNNCIFRMLWAVLLWWMSLALYPAVAIGAPVVTVSIAPIHSLLSGVMDGVDKPKLLFAGSQSPHGQYLTPSQMSILSASDLIVWVGSSLESGLVRAVQQQRPHTKVITLLQEPKILKIPSRRGGVWSTHDDDHFADADPHLWLSTSNAATMVELFRAKLSEIDPANAAQYSANAVRMKAKINRLHNDINQAIAPLRELPYLVFHDAYQYFETEFNFKPLGSVTLSTDHVPGAKRLSQLIQIIAQEQVKCIFYEPQFRPTAVQTLIENSDVRYAELDPIGATLKNGKEHWFMLMNNLMQSLLNCLS